MIVITWNIQWGRGVDGRVDLHRIVDTAAALGDFDVLCLQEVADHYPALPGLRDGEDQFAALARLLPGFHASEGCAVERHTPGVGRQRFGNLILSREPPLQVLRHQLPWPADPGRASMPRMALEVVLPTPMGPLRVTTTHLEYYSARQREAQFEALRALQAEAAAHDGNGPGGQEHKPFEPRPRGAAGILTGDFNCDAADPLVSRLQEPLDGAPAWQDSWVHARAGQPHPRTVGLYDDAQWQGVARTFDFIFVTADLLPRVRRVDADLRTQASDHQPLLLEIDTR